MDIIARFRNRQSVKKKKGYRVSRNIARKLLKKHGYAKRKAVKSQSTGEFKERDRQFKKIFRLRGKYERSGKPVISVDTKKKERLGNLYRDGQLYCLEEEVVYDHDYAHLSEGEIYSLNLKEPKSQEYDQALSENLMIQQVTVLQRKRSLKSS